MMAQPEILRLAIFIGLFAVLAVCEHRWPRRPLTVSKSRRWLVNLLIVVVDTAVARMILPIAPIALAALAQRRGWGLFNLAGLDGILPLVASILLLDMVIYGQHRFFHRTPLLWRLHRMHHTDLDFDVTTALRFHPLEIVLSMLIKLAVVLLLGAPAVAVLLFEVILNATAMFNHGNVGLPPALDRILRWMVVTPDMHRVHHSVRTDETNSNFGFNLPWWDRLFGTYRDQPRDGHTGMTLGLDYFRDQRATRLDGLLLQPFLNEREPAH